ncbi:hypothetical protein Tco_1155307 [Tanacetum coccineum]
MLTSSLCGVASRVPGNKLKECPKHKGIYVTLPIKEVFCNMMREGKVYVESSPLFSNYDGSSQNDTLLVKKRVKQLEKRRKSRTSGIKRLRKGRKIADLDDDEEVTLIDETQGRNDKDLMFDIDVLNGDEVYEEPIVNTAKTTSLIPVSDVDPVTTAGEVAVTTAATTITTDVASTIPKAKGIVFHDQEEQAPAFTLIVSSSQASQLPQAKDKGKAKMVEPKKPLKKKDQITLDEELALRLHAEEQAELERMQKDRVAQEEASRAAIIKELDSIQAMIEADEQLAARLQAEEQE